MVHYLCFIILTENAMTPNPTNTWCLFEGHHQLPQNRGPLFGASENPLSPERAEGFMQALATFASGEVVRLYVTGATFALTEFVGTCFQALGAGAQGSLVLLHFNRDTGGYRPQCVIRNAAHNPGEHIVTGGMYGVDYATWDGNGMSPNEWHSLPFLDRNEAREIWFQVGVANGTIDPTDCE